MNGGFLKTEGQEISQPDRDCGASKKESLSNISRVRLIANNIFFAVISNSWHLNVSPEQASACVWREMRCVIDNLQDY